MEISDFISKDHVFAGKRVNSKKQLLTELAETAADAMGLDQRDVFDTLLQRERLGSTGVGDGVAIPHGKLHKIDSIFGVVATLETPIDYDAIDDTPVDVVFLLLAPETAGADHLKALARISRLARVSGVLEKLRGSHSREALWAALTSEETRNAA